MRAFMWATRPLLEALNEAANGLLRRLGVQPASQIAVGHTPDALRRLVEHSANVGALDARYSAQISGALDMERTTLRELVTPGVAPTGVRADATVGEVRAATRSSGHLRILLRDGERIRGVVHVRDTLTAPDGAPGARFARPVFSLAADTTVHAALTSMRETRNHLAVVTEAGSVIGVITLADLLGRLFPQAATAA
jgi:CBS domain containing-hemolysin-like protein